MISNVIPHPTILFNIRVNYAKRVPKITFLCVIEMVLIIIVIDL